MKTDSPITQLRSHLRVKEIASKLNVTRGHLWRVANGERPSKSLTERATALLSAVRK